MNRVLVALAALAAGACAANPAAEPAAPAAVPASPRAVEGGAPVAGAAPEAEPTAVPARRHQTDDQLALWSDPAFQRHLVQSYVAETDVEPRIETAEREWLEKALDAISRDRLDEAARLIESQRGEGTNALFDFLLANVNLQRDRMDEAAPLYRMAVEKHPKFRRAWQQLGMVQVRRGEWAGAREALSRVVELGGGDGITWGLLAYALANLGDDLEAETAYRMAILLDPASLDWKMGLARSLFQQRRFADAVALCDGLLADDPDRAELWLLQANAYIGLGEPLRAAENYELVERLGKSNVDSLMMLGDIYVNAEAPDLALAAYVHALERHQRTDLDRLMRAAKVMNAGGAHAETQALLDALALHRGSDLSDHQRKELLKLQARLAVANGAGDAEEARILEEIVALDPLDGEALLLLGQHASRAGELEKAVFYYERAAGIEAFEADAKVRHAQLLAGQQRYAEALPLLRRAQALKPRDNVQDYLEEIERRVAQSAGRAGA